mgnify:CR=1 FL=1
MNLSLPAIVLVLLMQLRTDLRAQSANVSADLLPAVQVQLPSDPFADDPPNPEALPPPLPPDPNSPAFDNWIDAGDDEPLPPLEDELWQHGGSYLYVPEGDRLNWPADNEESHYDLLRLPEGFQKPRPLEGFAEFLGADPILVHPHLKWLGCKGYAWEPRFVGHGSYELLGFALEQNGRRQDVLGHQLIVDLDLRLTGTERFHVQYRPIGREATGGSYYQFNQPAGYVDNSTGEPDRYWFEMELHSVLGADFDPFAALDYNVTVGRVPLLLHNELLMSDELLAVILSKNTIIFREVSNVNVQGIYGFNDVGVSPNDDFRMYGIHATMDRHRDFFEATWAFVESDLDADRNAHYAALSATRFLGPTTLAARVLTKFGDEAGSGNGQLFVLESNRTRVFEHHPCGIEKGVFYANAFFANDGWSPLANGNLNRLRTSFEVNPLVRISAVPSAVDTWGVACGVQLFRHHEDESMIPEIAYQDVDGDPAVGMGLRYLRKTSSRTFFEALGIVTLANNPAFDREGVFLSYTIVF